MFHNFWTNRPQYSSFIVIATVRGTVSLLVHFINTGIVAHPAFISYIKPHMSILSLPSVKIHQQKPSHLWLILRLISLLIHSICRLQPLCPFLLLSQASVCVWVSRLSFCRRRFLLCLSRNGSLRVYGTLVATVLLRFRQPCGFLLGRVNVSANSIYFNI